MVAQLEAETSPGPAVVAGARGNDRATAAERLPGGVPEEGPEPGPHGPRPLVDARFAAAPLPASGDRGPRNARELKTLAPAIDHLLSRRFSEAGGLSAQRLRAVEASRQGAWAAARHLEVIGDSAFSA